MKKIYYIGDDANWVLDEIGKSLQRVLSNQNFFLTKNGFLNFGGINHYSSRYSVYSKELLLPFRSNILTYFHGEDTDTGLLKKLKDTQHKFSSIHTSCEKTRRHLLKNGIEDRKIVVIPIGIDVATFKPVDNLAKISTREKLGIPKDAYVIGSFQKDGVGWGDGMEPKLIKGPDIFCETIEKVSQKYSVHVFLTGPARGYVKNRLAQAKIPFTHIYLKNYNDIPNCFQALDAYLIGSRLEGGPRSPMECLASGIPVVSTDVGQVPEILKDGINGFISEIEDVEDLAKKIIHLIENQDLKKKVVEQGILDVQRFDYKIIANEYWNKLYKPILDRNF